MCLNEAVQVADEDVDLPVRRASSAVEAAPGEGQHVELGEGVTAVDHRVSVSASSRGR